MDERQRSLLILVNPADRPLIEAVVKYLDNPRPQIAFEAEVLEINRTWAQALGIDYDFIFRLGIRESDIPTPPRATSSVFDALAGIPSRGWPSPRPSTCFRLPGPGGCWPAPG